MNRRYAIQQLGLMTAGAMLLPGCIREPKKVSIALKNIAITGDDEQALADIVEALIPATDTPGAKELNVHQFVLRMVDDCQDTEHQQHFVTGLSQIDEAAKKRFNKSFEDCSLAEKQQWLNEWDERSKMEKSEEETMVDGKVNRIPQFYSLTKRYSIQGYLSSEFIMTNVMAYNMIPGRFDGCIEIKDKNDIKTIMG